MVRGREGGRERGGREGGGSEGGREGGGGVYPHACLSYRLLITMYMYMYFLPLSPLIELRDYVHVHIHHTHIQ